MLAAFVTTVLYAVASAFVPALPAEPYLVGVVATTGHNPLLLGIAAGIGQSAGKVVIFLAARGTIRSPWLRRRLARLTSYQEEAAAEASEDRTAEAVEVKAGKGAGAIEAGQVRIGTAAIPTQASAIEARTAAVPADLPPRSRPARLRRLAQTARTALTRRMPTPLRRLGAAAGRLTKAGSVWLARALERPVIAALTLFASAVTGIPPLLATSVYASATRMSVVQFGAVCVVGRSIRFAAIALTPTLLM